MRLKRALPNWKRNCGGCVASSIARLRQRPKLLINPVKIDETFYYLYTQDKSRWTHELQVTPYPVKLCF